MRWLLNKSCVLVKMKLMNYLLVCLFLLFSGAKAVAAERFVSLKSSEINMRVGPGIEYPINWVFMASNLPMQLVAEFGQWRKLRFIDNTEGWVHKNMISYKNTAIVVSNIAVLYKYESKSQPVARIEKNVIVRVLKHHKNWVKVSVCRLTGWMLKDDLWGVNSQDL